MIEVVPGVTIERLVAGGWGMAHEGSLVTFVPGTIPGETVSLRNRDPRRGYQFARVGDILEGSPHRVAPPCPIYGVCGGCQFQHVQYDSQLVQKQHLLQDAILRIAKVPVEGVRPPWPSPTPYHYRSWVRFVVHQDQSRWQLGFYQPKSHEFVPASECLLAPEAMGSVIQEIASRLARLARLPASISQVELRYSIASPSILLIFRGPAAQHKDIQALFAVFASIPLVVGCVWHATGREHGRGVTRWVDGQDHLMEHFGGLTVRISDRSFMQANWPMFEAVGQTLVQWVDPNESLRILELYAGTGCLGLALACGGGLVTEVEPNPFALADARKTATLNHVGRCRFRRGSAESFLAQTHAGEYDVILADPPRTGLSKESLAALAQLKVPRMLYLSCDAPSLARDLGRLYSSGYRVSRLQAFDMFPQTAHLETLVELSL